MYKRQPKEDNTHLPPQFNGLLPDRNDPTVAPDAPHAVEHDTGAPVVTNETQRDSISEAGLPAGGAKVGGPDFEAAFAGMNLAPAAEAEDDDDEPETHVKNTNDFDFSFDTPAQKQQPLSATNTGQGNSSEFFSFDNNTHAATAQPVGSPSEGGPKPAAHEWDALFAPLDNAQPSTGEDSHEDKSKQPGWALDTDTGEDDQILQRLTGMGFDRNASLDALEKFDYNLDKVSIFLIQTHVLTDTNLRAGCGPLDFEALIMRSPFFHCTYLLHTLFLTPCLLFCNPSVPGP